MTRRPTTAVKILVAAVIGACVLMVAPAALAMTWAGPEASPTTRTLYSVSCPDTSHCFAVGGTTSAGKIIDTANAAAASPTWSTQTPPSNATGQYNAISCADDNDCIVVGNTSSGAPLIVATANGGTTWSKQTPPSSATAALQGVSCASSTHCVAVGNVVGSSPVIIATVNGGSSWNTQTAPATNAALNDVNCPSTTVCYAVGGANGVATLLVTVNGGSTWTAQTPPSGDNQALNAVTCTSTTVCFAVGNAVSGTGEIAATTNGGVNWSYQSDGSQLSLYGVSCWDATDCVAVGASGRVALTTNGTGWSWLNSPTSDTLYSVDVSNDTTGSAVGASGTILGYSLGCNSSGGVNFTPPTSLSWPSTALTGRDQSISTALNLSPDDETGSEAGWNLSATSTTFTSGTHTLPTTAAMIIAASATAGTGNCSLPVNQISYPLTVPAAASAPSAIKIFDAGPGTGAGPVNVAMTASLNVPGNARTGTYTSTWTITLSSGP